MGFRIRFRRAVAALGSLALVFGIAAAASAQQPAGDVVYAVDVAKGVESLEKRGYKNVHDVEYDDGAIEADATAPAGHGVELRLDPKSLAIIREVKD
jgi:hypothetical protein